MEKQFVKFATATAKVAGKPWTFIGCLAIVLVWALSGPVFKFSETWQLVINTGTTIITFLMVFLIQNTQNRDGAAMQADERFIGIEHLTERDLDRILVEVEARAQRLHGDNPLPVVATRAEDVTAASRKAAGKTPARKTRRPRKAST
jgi:low affinity Fe/Cu permease